MVTDSALQSTRNEPSTGRQAPGAAAHRGVDVIYVLDCSRSMGDRLSSAVKSSKLELSRTALVSTIADSAGFTPGDRVGVIAANTNIFAKPVINVVIPLQEATAPVSGNRIPIDKIASLRAEGGTAWAPAMRQAIKMLAEAERRGNSQQIIVITDSRNNTVDQPVKIIPEAVKRRIKIHMVNLGNKKDREQLKLPSDLSGGESRFAETARELGSKLLLPVFPPKHRLVQSTPPAASGPLAATSSIASAGGAADAVPTRREIDPQRIFLITPKRKKARSSEEVEAAVNEIAAEYSHLTDKLREGRISQAEFSEKYSILQFELQELKQSLSELRAKLSREMSEYALSRQRDPSDENLQRQNSERLLRLERQVEKLRSSATSAPA